MANLALMLLRGHLMLLVPEVEDRARLLPADDPSRCRALAGVGEAQRQLSAATGPGFQRLVRVTRDAARERFGPGHEPYLVLQLTHSGRFSRTAPECGRRAACFNPHFDRAALPEWTDGDLDRVRDAFVAAARLAAGAGFDAVDIKACHGYLLHELLGAHTRARSRYGGPFICIDGDYLYPFRSDFLDYCRIWVAAGDRQINPSSANTRDIPLPIPLAPPVTNAVFPFNPVSIN